MTTMTQKQAPKQSKAALEEVLQKAMKKVGVRKENDLCKYIPMETGGYIHHFTLKKMKLKEPQALAAFVEKYILQTDKPKAVAPKSRAPRGSKKKKDHMNFTRNQLERMLSIAKLAGDKEIITILSPKKSLAAAKRELLRAVKNNRADLDLWQNFSDAVTAHNALTQETASAGQ